MQQEWRPGFAILGPLRVGFVRLKIKSRWLSLFLLVRIVPAFWTISIHFYFFLFNSFAAQSTVFGWIGAHVSVFPSLSPAAALITVMVVWTQPGLRVDGASLYVQPADILVAQIWVCIQSTYSTAHRGQHFSCNVWVGAECCSGSSLWRCVCSELSVFIWSSQTAKMEALRRQTDGK